MQCLQISEFFSDLWLHNTYVPWDIYYKWLCVLKWQSHKINLVSISDLEWEVPKSGHDERKRRKRKTCLYSSKSTLQILVHSFFFLLQTHFGSILQSKCMENIDLVKLTQDRGQLLIWKYYEWYSNRRYVKNPSLIVFAKIFTYVIS